MNLNTAQLGGSWPRIPCINHSTIIVHNISINQISINNYPSWLNRCVGILMQHQTSTGFNYYSVNVLHFQCPHIMLILRNIYCRQELILFIFVLSNGCYVPRTHNLHKFWFWRKSSFMVTINNRVRDKIIELSILMLSR